MEEARNEVCFKTGLTGFHITLFFFYLNKIVVETNNKDLNDLVKRLDTHSGCLDRKIEDAFQK